MAKVSIIVPVYNPQEKHLIQCLDSLISQSLQNIEIILIDNASIGNNPDILKKYASKDNRINLIIFEKNQGYAGACNKGLEIATGEYIQIVDSDDWLESNACEELSGFMDSKPFVDFCFLGARIFNEQRNKFSNNKNFEFLSIKNLFNSQTFSFKEAKNVLFKQPSQAWNKFYRTSFLKKFNNQFDEELGTILVDALFSFKNYINANSMILNDKILYNYRTNIKGSVVNSIRQDYTDKPIVFCKKMEKIQEEKQIEGKESEPFVITCLEALFWFYSLYNLQNKRLFYKDLKKYFKTNNKNIYTRENILNSGFGMEYWMIERIPFILFRLSKNILQINIKKDYKRIKLFNITLFKLEKDLEYTNCKLLGFVSLKFNREGVFPLGGGVEPSNCKCYSLIQSNFLILLCIRLFFWKIFKDFREFEL